MESGLCEFILSANLIFIDCFQHAHGLTFHTCDRSIDVSLVPFTRWLVACPALFDTIIYTGLVAASGYGREILHETPNA